MATMNNTSILLPTGTAIKKQYKSSIPSAVAMGNKLDFSLVKRVTVFLGRQVGCRVHRSYKDLGIETERRMEQH